MRFLAYNVGFEAMHEISKRLEYTKYSPKRNVSCIKFSSFGATINSSLHKNLRKKIRARESRCRENILPFSSTKSR